jgi:nicotinamidase/pyrazinamidase
MLVLLQAAVLQACLATGSGQKTALLIIDVQDCFIEGGSLEVPAKHIIPVINQIRADAGSCFDLIIRTQDFHPANHISFGSTHGLAAFSHLTRRGGLPITCVNPSSKNTADASCCPLQHIYPEEVDCTSQLCPPANWSWSANNSAFIADNVACTQCKATPSSCFNQTQAMWTDHCLQSGDSGFPSNLTKLATDIIVKKGENLHVDAYSAFMDNSKNLYTSLESTLQSRNVTTIYVAGIATDVCVKWTVEDALSERTGKYTVKVISDASAGLTSTDENPPTQSHKDALDSMEDKGAQIVTSADVLAMSCAGNQVSGSEQLALRSSVLAFFGAILLAIA